MHLLGVRIHMNPIRIPRVKARYAVIRRRHSYSVIVVLEELEDTKGVIKIRISKKNRQHNGHKKRYKRTNNGLQNIYKIKDRVTRTPLQPCQSNYFISCQLHVNYKCNISCFACMCVIKV
jgi:peptidyl-tRNA hydrolase